MHKNTIQLIQKSDLKAINITKVLELIFCAWLGYSVYIGYFLHYIIILIITK